MTTPQTDPIFSSPEFAAHISALSLQCMALLKQMQEASAAQLPSSLQADFQQRLDTLMVQLDQLLLSPLFRCHPALEPREAE